jgi:hypothetical protein
MGIGVLLTMSKSGARPEAPSPMCAYTIPALPPSIPPTRACRARLQKGLGFRV